MSTFNGPRGEITGVFDVVTILLIKGKGVLFIDQLNDPNQITRCGENGGGEYRERLVSRSLVKRVVVVVADIIR